jgi:hypothetical protein
LENYDLLARIADLEGRPNDAHEHRQRARAALAAAPVARETLRPRRDLIMAVAAAATDPAQRLVLDQKLEAMIQRGWDKLVPALRHVLEGERDEETLCDGLDWEDALIVGAVLRGIADPATLDEDNSPDEPASDAGMDTDN